MDEFILLLGLISIFIIPTFIILSIIAIAKGNKLERKIVQLEKVVEELKRNAFDQSPEINAIHHEPILSESSVEKPQIESVAVSIPEIVEPQVVELIEKESVDFSEPDKRDSDSFITHFKENWLVWIGGLSMVVGSICLIESFSRKDAVPLWLRMFVSVLGYSILMLIGEKLHRKIKTIKTGFLHKKEGAYIPAIFYAAGLSGLYGVILFLTKTHSVLMPIISLSLIALLVFFALSLVSRFGSLMAILALFGGYIAPSWIETPNFYAVVGYVFVISIAGILTQQGFGVDLFREKNERKPIQWLTLPIIIGHCAWVAVLSSGAVNRELFYLVPLMISASAYLLIFVPEMGWRLNNSNEGTVAPAFCHTAFPAAILSIISVIHCYYIDTLTLSSAVLFLCNFICPFLLLIVPAIRKGRAFKSSKWLNIVAAITVFRINLDFFENGGASRDILLIVYSIFLVLLFVRTITHYVLVDQSKLSRFLAVWSAPILLIIQIFHEFNSYAELAFSIFAVAGIGYAALKVKDLQKSLSATMHIIVLALNIQYCPDNWFNVFTTLQLAVLAVQHLKNWIAPSIRFIRVSIAIWVIYLSSIAQIPYALEIDAPRWSWMICATVPTLLVLGATRYFLSKRAQGSEELDNDKIRLAEWLDVVLMHLGVILFFGQTSYLLEGEFSIVATLFENFNALALFVSQCLALALIYQLKQKCSQYFAKAYRVYSLILMALAGVAIVVLNTGKNPLLYNYVSGTDFPIFNILALGWLVPSIILFAMEKLKLRPAKINKTFMWVVICFLWAKWTILTIRQIWQAKNMTLNMPTSMSEWMTYSVALIAIGVFFTARGFKQNRLLFKRSGFIILGIACIKVFVFDTATLEGFLRALSFMGLGGSLVVLGWFYQKTRKTDLSLNSENDENG